MAIKINDYFNRHIQSRDTSLIPLVQIKLHTGNIIYLSTNPYVEYAADRINYRPILLSIPALKESIDIESRKYKISSIRLNISNAPYSGKRFTELLDGVSLINAECRIWWAAPNADWTIDTPGDQDGAALLVYNGIVRRFDHDDDKGYITAEDRTEAVLHNNVPTHNLGYSDGVPDKYKNKPFPLIYGQVSNSPLVLSSTLSGAGESEIVFHCDHSSISHFNNYSGNLKPLTFFEGGYVEVAGSVSHDLYTDDNLYEAGSQYEIDNNRLKINPLIFNQQTDSDPESNINAGIVYCRKDMYPTNVRLLNQKDWIGPSGGVDGDLNVFYKTDPQGTPLATLGTGSMLNLNGWNDSGILISGYAQIYVSGGYHERSLGLSLQFDHASSDIITGATYYLIGNFTAVNESYGGDGSYPNTKLQIYVKIGDPTEPYKYIHVHRDIGGSSTDYETQAIHDFRIFDINAPYPNYGVPTLKGVSPNPVFILTASREPGTNDTTTTWVNYNIDIRKLGFISSFWVENIFDKDFYGNVSGRVATNSFPEITNDLLVQELNMNPEYIEDVPNSPYNNWEYDFTIHETINSKKLIEDFASATPFLPRFDNRGIYKLSHIATEGGVLTDDLEGNEYIKANDALEYSYSRTKIDIVYTKIILNYDWDYGRKKFSRSYDTTVDDIMDNYEYSHYGLSQDDSQSTLEINDHRGKFIRKLDTAEKFTKWMLFWYANQHLKIKVKLPLKYLNLEIGDIVQFDKVLGGVDPYGIDYHATGVLNGQTLYHHFLIISTNKTLEYCEIEVIQMHNCAECLDGDNFGVLDCNGLCNGPALVNECGYCSEADADLNLCPCENGACNPESGCHLYLDCAEVCGGDAVEDICGTCGGGGYDCDGCMTQDSLNYNEAALTDNGSCLEAHIELSFFPGDEGGTPCCANPPDDLNNCNDRINGLEGGWSTVEDHTWYGTRPELFINLDDHGYNATGWAAAKLYAKWAFEENGGMEHYEAMSHPRWFEGGYDAESNLWSNRPIIYYSDPAYCEGVPEPLLPGILAYGGFEAFGESFYGLQPSEDVGELMEVHVDHYIDIFSESSADNFGYYAPFDLVKFKLSYSVCTAWNPNTFTCDGYYTEPYVPPVEEINWYANYSIGLCYTCAEWDNEYCIRAVISDECDFYGNNQTVPSSNLEDYMNYQLETGIMFYRGITVWQHPLGHVAAPNVEHQTWIEEQNIRWENLWENDVFVNGQWGTPTQVENPYSAENASNNAVLKYHVRMNLFDYTTWVSEEGMETQMGAAQFVNPHGVNFWLYVHLQDCPNLGDIVPGMSRENEHQLWSEFLSSQDASILPYHCSADMNCNGIIDHPLDVQRWLNGWTHIDNGNYDTHLDYMQVYYGSCLNWGDFGFGGS